MSAERLAPAYAWNGVTLYVGHCLDVLAQLPAESVQCVVTSPPYWGLRAYGTEPQIWGGSLACDHQLPAESAPGRPPRNHNGQGNTTLHETGPHGVQPHGAQETPKLDAQWDAWQATAPGKVLTGGTGTVSAKQVSNNGSQYGNAWADEMRVARDAPPSASSTLLGNGHQGGGPKLHTPAGVSTTATCLRCGAWRGELGSEPTPDLYITHLVEVFRAVRRVLHPTGTIWVNMGDSYNAGTRAGRAASANVDVGGWQHDAPGGARCNAPGLGPKQLMMLPARVALALQADGWVLRSAITWAKKSPMPESVRDRPTSATEMVYLLAKQPRYYYDAEAVRQPSTSEEQEAHNQRYAKVYEAADANALFRQPGNVNSLGIHSRPGPGGANLRNFWLLGPEPYPAAHFATFVPEIPRLAILAGTSARGQCPACGAPWRRVVERERGDDAPATTPKKEALVASGQWNEPRRGQSGHPPGWRKMEPDHLTATWAQSCPCPPADPVPQTVLDPFAGSGTALAVARWHQRRAVGIELSADYARLVAQRLQQGVLDFGGLG